MSTKPAKRKMTEQEKWRKSFVRLKTINSWKKASKNQKNVWIAELIEQYQYRWDILGLINHKNAVVRQWFKQRNIKS